MRPIVLLSWIVLAAAAPARHEKYDVDFAEESYDPSDVLYRDVCIIGGGGTGTYAAVRLHDMGKSVMVVERDTELGGHTRSYKAPGHDAAIDLGVQAYSDTQIVRQFFDRFDIPLSHEYFHSIARQWADFQTGEYLPDFKLPNISYDDYGLQLEKYPYLEWTMDLPDPVPEELLLPFGEFARSRHIKDIVKRIFSDIQGLGDVLRLPAVYVFQAVGSQFLRDIKTHVLVTTRHNNHELFEEALKALHQDVLLSSRVVGTRRIADNSLVKLVVKTPNGHKLINAKRLLVTIPLTTSNMASLDPDDTEMSLFSQFSSKAWYVALVSNTSLPEDAVITSAAPFICDEFPALPALHIVVPTHVQGIHLVKYASTYPISDGKVKSDMRMTIAKLGERDNRGNKKTAADIEILDYQAHVPFELTVPAEAIRNGFYSKLYALQGSRNTWYTGLTFLSAHAANLWNFTEALIPRMIQGL